MSICKYQQAFILPMNSGGCLHKNKVFKENLSNFLLKLFILCGLFIF